MTTPVDPLWVRDLWAYDHHDRPRPFVHPLRTPAGHVLSLDAPADHPWHHALWFTIKFVNGENFWEEYGEFGLLAHTSGPTLEVAADGGAVLSGELAWERPDGEIAVHETRTLAHVPLDEDAYGIDWHVRLVPTVDTVFDRTPFDGWGGYGGLTLRGRPDWRDTRLLVDDGTTHERLLGDASRWCDLSGTVAGADDAPDAEAGVLFCDHPGNVRHPVPWYASTRAATYGDEGWSNFMNAAFLWHEPLQRDAGDALELRLRVVVHDGIWEAARCESTWRAWIDESGATP